MDNATPATPPHFKQKVAPNPPAGQISGGEVVTLRNEFYRDNFRRLMILCLMMMAAIGGLIGFIFFQHATQPQPTYFATNADGSLVRMVPLNKPNLSTNALLAWSAEAATAVFNYDFVHYREDLQRTQEYFTPAGYQQMLKALKESGNLEAVKTKKLVASAVPTGSPVITKESIINNRYTWEMQIPMAVSYQSGTELIPQKIVITMLVARVPTTESAKGIGIAQFIVREGELRLGS